MELYPDNIRSNPSAFLMYAPSDPRSVHLVAIESVFLAFANTGRDGSHSGCATASALRITIHSDGSLTVFDDGIGLPVSGDAIEVCFTNKPEADERRHTSLAILNALSERLAYATAQGGSQWAFQTERGKSVSGLRQTGDCPEQWQSLTVKPDPSIFSHQVTFDGFSDMLQMGLNGHPPFEEPFRYAVQEVPVHVIDAASKQQRQLSTAG